MLTITFDDEAYEIAAHILSNEFPSGGGIKGMTVDIAREPHGITHTYVVVGANQREDEDEIKLVVREFDHESGDSVGPELRLSWDTTLKVN